VGRRTVKTSTGTFERAAQVRRIACRLGRHEASGDRNTPHDHPRALRIRRTCVCSTASDVDTRYSVARHGDAAPYSAPPAPVAHPPIPTATPTLGLSISPPAEVSPVSVTPSTLGGQPSRTPTPIPMKPPTGTETCCMCDYEEIASCASRKVGVDCIHRLECSDEKDNDRDGLVDIDDPDCGTRTYAG
jgi:hypothetical protein